MDAGARLCLPGYCWIEQRLRRFIREDNNDIPIAIRSSVAACPTAKHEDINRMVDRFDTIDQRL